MQPQWKMAIAGEVVNSALQCRCAGECRGAGFSDLLVLMSGTTTTRPHTHAGNKIAAFVYDGDVHGLFTFLSFLFCRSDDSPRVC